MAAGDSSRLRAIAHPLRLHMLSLLTGTELSAAELARELGTTQANASYHLRVLAGAGHVVEAESVKIRGGVAKRYRHPWREPQPSGDRPRSPDDHRLLVEALCLELTRRASAAAPGRGHTTDAEMWVPPQVWGEVLDLVARAGELIHNAAQPPRTAGTVHVNLTLAAFPMRDGDGRAHATA